MAFCKFCGKEIVWLKEGRKSIPVEVDGAKHECENFTNSRKSAKKMERGDIDPELIAQYEAQMKAELEKKKKK